MEKEVETLVDKTLDKTVQVNFLATVAVVVTLFLTLNVDWSVSSALTNPAWVGYCWFTLNFLDVIIGFITLLSTLFALYFASHPEATMDTGSICVLTMVTFWTAFLQAGVRYSINALNLKDNTRKSCAVLAYITWTWICVFLFLTPILMLWHRFYSRNSRLHPRYGDLLRQWVGCAV